MAKPQLDWPRNTVVTGFPFYDRRDYFGETGTSPDLLKFLDEGPPPIVFTLGSSAVWVARDFYGDSIAAAQALADRVAIVKDGVIVAEGAPSDLSARGSSYRVAWLQDGRRREVETDDPTSLLHQLTGEALDRGERLEGLSVTRPSLEDVYLDLTADEESAARVPEEATR